MACGVCQMEEEKHKKVGGEEVDFDVKFVEESGWRCSVEAC